MTMAAYGSRAVLGKGLILASPQGIREVVVVRAVIVLLLARRWAGRGVSDPVVVAVGPGRGVGRDVGERSDGVRPPQPLKVEVTVASLSGAVRKMVTSSRGLKYPCEG
jgi:hypothetical protein